MNVQRSSIPELEASPMFADLLAEYAAESAIDGMPAPSARMDIYRHLETKGALHVISGTVEGELAGFITVLAPVMPHYGVPLATSESFFVTKRHRNSLGGLKLLTAAEDKARDLGSPGLLVSAPYGGKLFEVLPRCGYVETNRAFFKKVGNAVAVAQPGLPAMSPEAIAKVRAAEDFSLAHAPQAQISTNHLIHAGMYARTIVIPAGCVLTGALVKLATLLIVSGDADIYIGGEAVEMRGYNVLPAQAGRKQLFAARTDVCLTMIFPTEAMTVADAEVEFTDEYEKLFSRNDTGHDRTMITGE